MSWVWADPNLWIGYVEENGWMDVDDIVRRMYSVYGNSTFAGDYISFSTYSSRLLASLKWATMPMVPIIKGHVIQSDGNLVQYHGLILY